MQPDPNTAIILDTIITQLNNIKRSQDLSLAITEFALGFPTSSRLLDICFGFNVILAQEMDKDVDINRGIYRVSGNTLKEYLTSSTHNSLSIQSLLGTTKLQNVYAFGSIYAYLNGDNDVVVAAKMLSGDTNLNLYITRDIDETAIVSMIKDNIIPAAIIDNSVELFRFVLNIDYYYGVNNRFNDFDLILLDMRKPRGWAGYAEENMAVNLCPVLIERKNNINSNINTNIAKTGLEDTVKNIVSVWMKMFDNFEAFWSSGENTLPTNLNAYIQANF